MKINISKNYDEMSMKVAKHIASYLNEKPDSLFCFAGGDTPLKIYQKLVEMNERGEVDFSRAYFVSLDEWVGLGYETEGSCIETLYNSLYKPLKIDKKKQICFFDGLALDIDSECDRVNKFINEKGGIDIALLGIGMNGHLGFNEPNVNPEMECGVVPLEPITAKVGAKYFKEKLILKAGITIGLKQLLKSKNLILIANGEKKSEIVRQTIENEITIEIPSTMARKNENSFMYLDEKAILTMERENLDEIF